MKNNHFKKIKTISFSLIIIALMILFVYREKVFRNERSLYEEQIAEMNEFLAQAEEVQKARAEEIQKIRAEEITPKAEAENIEEIVPEETSESDGRAWLAAERQLQVGDNIPVRYYIEQTQIALEDTDENVGTALYFENPVFLMGDSCDGWSWVDNPSPETVIINELLDKKRDEFIDRYKEDFKNMSVVGFVDFGMDALLRYPYYCSTDVTNIYYHEDGVLSIGYYYAWYAGGSGNGNYDSVNVDWHTGKEISLPEFLNMSNEETKELVTKKVLEYKKNHPEYSWTSEAEYLNERAANEFEKLKFYIWEEEIYVLFDSGTLVMPGGLPIKIRIR